MLKTMTKYIIVWKSIVTTDGGELLEFENYDFAKHTLDLMNKHSVTGIQFEIVKFLYKS